MLEDVVVIGYGTQKRGNLTGSISSESHQLGREGQAEDGPRRHDGGAQTQGDPVDLPDPALLPGAVVIADDGTHPLNDAAGGKVEEGLELVIDPQDHHIDGGEDRENAVEGGDQQGGQRQAQRRGDPHGVQAEVQPPVPGQIPPAQCDGKRAGAPGGQIDQKGQGLPDAGGQGGPLDAQLWEGAGPEDQQRIQYDVGQLISFTDREPNKIYTQIDRLW